MGEPNKGMVVDQPDARKRWERLPGEPNRWFDRFDYYRLRGASRAFLECYEQDLARKGAIRRDKNGLPQAWRNAIRKWEWRKRAEAWDAFEREENERAWERRRAELREQEWDIGTKLLDKAKQMLVYPLATTRREQKDGENIIVTQVNPARWSFGDAPKFADVASKLARLAAGLETEHGKFDFTNMSDAEIIAEIKSQLEQFGFIPSSGGGESAGTDSPDSE